MGGVSRHSRREGIYVDIGLIHFVVQQKPTQHCKAIMLQLKKKNTIPSYSSIPILKLPFPPKRIS